MSVDTAQPNRPDRATLLAFLAVVVFGGANAIAVKFMVQDVPPLWSAAIRFLSAGLILAVVAFAMRREWPRRASLLGALAYGALGFAASYGLLYTALRDVPAGTAMVLIAMTPLFTLGLAIAHRQERFRALGLVGALTAAAGIAIVFGDQVSAAVPLGALLLIVVGTLAIAESGVIVKWIPRSDPFSTNAVAMLSGGGLLLVASMVAEEGFALPASVASWIALTYLVVLGSVTMFVLYLFALARWTASAMSYTTLLMPLVTVALAAVLFAETVSLAFIVGGAVILAGVYIGTFAGRTSRRSTATAAPECLPIADCADAAPSPATTGRARAASAGG